MFEAARPESGGHWERGGQGWRLGRGGQGTGTDRGGGLLKRCSFYPSPMPSAPSSLYSVAGQLGVPQALGHLNMAPHPLPQQDGFHGEVNQDFPCRPRPKARCREEASLPPPLQKKKNSQQFPLGGRDPQSVAENTEGNHIS